MAIFLSGLFWMYSIILSLRRSIIVEKSCACRPEVKTVAISSDCFSDQFKSHRATQPVKSNSCLEALLRVSCISHSRLTIFPVDVIHPVHIKATISSIERSIDSSEPVKIPEYNILLS